MRPTFALHLLTALVLAAAWPAAPASADVIVTIQRPLNRALVDETLEVFATVTSTRALASVTAQVGPRQTSLTFGECAFTDRNGDCQRGFAGSLSLLGLARGPQALTVTATDVDGAFDDEVRTIILDLPPSLSVVSPREGTVARPDLDVDASCADDDECTITVTANGSVIASGLGSVQTLISLAAFDGRRVVVEFDVVDSVGQRAGTDRVVFVESSGRYVEVETVNGLILDAHADRLLWLDTSGSVSVLNVRDRATRDEEPVPAIAEREPWYGFLVPLGAIFVAGGVSQTLIEGVYEWRDGSLIKLEGLMNGSNSLTAKGSFAIWSGGADETCCSSNLFRRDLSNGTTIDLGNAGNSANDVAENGDVAFAASSFDIFRYRDGTTTPLTNDTDTDLWNQSPVTDGVNVVYAKRSPCCGDPQTGAIAMFGDAGEVILAPARSQLPFPGSDFRAAGGWVAYTKTGIGGERQVWRRAPDGTESQLSFFGTSSRLFGLSPTGEILFTNDRLYLSRPGSELLDVASNVVISHAAVGEAFWIDGGWHVALGRSLFRIDADNTTPATPTGLAQSRTDGVSAIAIGGMTPETMVVLQATVSDLDSGQTVRLQVEVQAVGTAFTNRPTAEGPLVTSGSTAFVTTGSLANGSYHWQARTVDELGVTGPWVPFGGNAESIADFAVNLVAPPEPTLVSPAGTITDTTPTYAWNAVAEATVYLLHVNDGLSGQKIFRAYTAAAAGCGTGTGICSVTPTTQLAAGPGKWRVQARNGLANGPWPSMLTFTVVAAAPSRAPTTRTPAGTVIDTTPIYTWNAVPEATSYLLQVNDAAVVKKIYTMYTAAAAGCGSGIGTCSVTPETELATGGGRWRVQARNSFGRGPWPSARTFTVVPGAPAKAPALIAPTGTIPDTTFTYTWNAVPEATSYLLQVNDAVTVKKIYTAYTAAEAGCPGGTGRCSVTPPTALAAGEARWRVQAHNGLGEGRWPSAVTFDVFTSPPSRAPTLIAPAGTVTDPTPTYRWNAVEGATSYFLQVNDVLTDQKTFTRYTAAAAGCASGTGRCSVTPGVELAAGAHKWRVLAENKFGKGPWPVGLGFTVDAP